VADLDDLAARLDAFAEELAEAALAALRAAVEEGRSGRVEIERRITRARRSVERAASLLRDGEGGDEG